MAELPVSIYKEMPRLMPRSLGFKRYALLFDGVDDYVEVADSPLLSNIAPITLEAFIKPLSAGSNDYGRICSKGPGLVFTFHISSGKYVVFKRNFTTQYAWAVTKTGSIEWGKTYHVVGVLDDEKFPHIYINGIEADYDRQDQGIGDIEDDSGNLYVGNCSALDHAFHGQIFLLRIYNRALTPEEIRHNIIEYHNPVRDGLVLWLHDFIVGDTWHDESSLANDGKIYGAVRKELAMWEIRSELGL